MNGAAKPLAFSGVIFRCDRKCWSCTQSFSVYAIEVYWGLLHLISTDRWLWRYLMVFLSSNGKELFLVGVKAKFYVWKTFTFFSPSIVVLKLPDKKTDIFVLQQWKQPLWHTSMKKLSTLLKFDISLELTGSHHPYRSLPSLSSRIVAV